MPNLVFRVKGSQTAQNTWVQENLVYCRDIRVVKINWKLLWWSWVPRGPIRLGEGKKHLG